MMPPFSRVSAFAGTAETLRKTRSTRSATNAFLVMAITTGWAVRNETSRFNAEFSLMSRPFRSVEKKGDDQGSIVFDHPSGLPGLFAQLAALHEDEHVEEVE